jgi:hypothetical protein
VRRFGPQSCIVADNFLGVPVQHQDKVHPTRGFDTITLAISRPHH